MRRFNPVFQGLPWEDGTHVLHVYACPDLTRDHDLAALVTACHQAMKPYPITIDDPAVLHITLEMVADTTADQISPTERQTLTTALHEHLADVAPIEALLGSPVANKAGVLLDSGPDPAINALRDRVRQALVSVRGPGTLQHDGGRAHMTLGYAWGNADSDPLQSALRRISPSHATMTIDRVHLLDVCFRQRHDDTAGWAISWNQIAEIPLNRRQ